MPETNRGNRPLSPHLQIYRPQITSVLSILNRVTGVSLALGGILIVWWLVAAAVSADYFAFVDRALMSWFGILVLVASLWALWFHTLNGVRHLVWDVGRGFDLATVARSGWAVVAGSFLLTGLTLLAV